MFTIALWNHDKGNNIVVNFYGYRTAADAWCEYSEKKAQFEKMLDEGDFADGSVYRMTSDECYQLGYMVGTKQEGR